MIGIAEKNEGWTGPLMIVGASRSGTAMVLSMLNRHSAIGVTGETHYFDDLRDRRHEMQAKLETSEQADYADYFRAIDARPYGMGGDPNSSRLSRDDIINRARTIGGRPDDYFEAYCRLTAERTGKRIWGDKTPRHVFRLPDIVDAFPEARFICMIRDPRAVVASYRRWRNQGGLKVEGDKSYLRAIAIEEARAQSSYNIVIATLLWRASVNAAMSGRAAYGDERVLIQRYEDILEDPESTGMKICSWLGVDYDPDMLAIPMHNSSFSAYKEKSGISREPLDRWRATLSAREIAIIQKVAGSCLTDAGYRADDVMLNPAVYGWEWLKAIPAVFRGAVVNRSRIGRMGSYIGRRLLLAWRH